MQHVQKMEVSEKVYEDGTTSKTPIRGDDNRASVGRKQRGKKVASSTNPIKGCAGKCNTRHEGYLRNCPTGEKPACCMAPRNIHNSA